jgi:hypothetical protein
MNREREAEVPLLSVLMTLPSQLAHCDELAEAPAVWLDNSLSQRPDERRMPRRGRSDRGTGAGRSAEGNDETAGNVEDEVPGLLYTFPVGEEEFRGLHHRTGIQMGPG